LAGAREIECAELVGLMFRLRPTPGTSHLSRGERHH
jgi:hypothetical protein